MNITRTTDLIKLMPTQFKRVNENNPLYVGHHIPLLGYWTKDSGYVKKNSLEYSGETLACPVIAIVTKKVGKNNLTLTITAKTSKLKESRNETNGDYDYTRKTYEEDSNITGTLTIPRHTRQWATFVVTSLGQKVFEISSITDNVDFDDGKVEFYALASSGSKLIYWFGIHMLAEQLREILRPWIAPTVCTRCSGTGVEPSDSTKDCYQCEGYKYSGWNSVKYVQRIQSFDVGLGRDLIDDWDSMSSTEYETIMKFINKCWTQKWWITPTVNEIKRMFAHFYNLEEESIYITERFNSQEPIWYLYLPQNGGESGSPFTTFGADDIELMNYIAESITPAGVSVFVGFYGEWEIGDLEDFDDLVIVFPRPETSIEPVLGLLGCGRWDFYEGWTEATIDFEGTTIQMDTFGDVELLNVNDQNRHMLRLGGGAYAGTGISETGSGFFELWMHPVDSVLRVGILSGSTWLTYVDYDEDGFYDHFGNLLTLACEDCDYHVKVDYQILDGSGIADFYINRYLVGNNILFLNEGIPNSFRIQSIGTGEGYVDGIGLFSDINYNEGDNWQRLHPWGWGRFHLNNLSGEENLLENYFERDRFFVI